MYLQVSWLIWLSSTVDVNLRVVPGNLASILPCIPSFSECVLNCALCSADLGINLARAHLVA